MKLAFVTEYDARNVKNWSGLGHHISRALEQQGIQIEYLGPFTEKLGWLTRLKRKYYTRIARQNFLAPLQPEWADHTARQITRGLAGKNVDLLLCPHPQTVGRLSLDRPVVLWADATFAGLLNFYADYSHVCPESIRNGHALDQRALDQCRLAIFASDWAARTAVDHYRTDPAKVKVVPFGANIECTRSTADIEQLMTARPAKECRLIFIGRIWERKGGDFAIEVARRLNESGLPATLTLVGSQPPAGKELPPFVQSAGFLDKSTPEGRNQFNHLLGGSHFLILPTRADCFGVVFCEASSFGVPSLSTDVGGVPSAVRAGFNGQTFPLDASPSVWAEHIRSLLADRARYEALARSSFAEYQTRLNWKTSGARVRELLEQALR